mmetsp:Transcript_8093/g.19901  ORF Transcript_8093/g.19901 Transcript_8093/m.19901 type:complete len:231 (-) Transcript_8093:2234-2926(-)
MLPETLGTAACPAEGPALSYSWCLHFLPLAAACAASWLCMTLSHLRAGRALMLLDRACAKRCCCCSCSLSSCWCWCCRWCRGGCCSLPRVLGGLGHGQLHWCRCWCHNSSSGSSSRSGSWSRLAQGGRSCAICNSGSALRWPRHARRWRRWGRTQWRYTSHSKGAGWCVGGSGRSQVQWGHGTPGAAHGCWVMRPCSCRMAYRQDGERIQWTLGPRVKWWALCFSKAGVG